MLRLFCLCIAIAASVFGVIITIRVEQSRVEQREHFTPFFCFVIAIALSLFSVVITSIAIAGILPLS